MMQTTSSSMECIGEIFWPGIPNRNLTTGVYCEMPPESWDRGVRSKNQKPTSAPLSFHFC
jgi:hypothetical protein